MGVVSIERRQSMLASSATAVAPFHTPNDHHGVPSNHPLIIFIFYNNGPTHQPPHLYMPPPLLLCKHGEMMGHEILEEGGVDSDNGYDGGE